MPPTRPPSSEHAGEDPLVETSEGGNYVHRLAWMARRRGYGVRMAEIRPRPRDDRERSAGALDASPDDGPALAPPGAPGTRNWTPMGPSAVGQGQAFGRPVVSGRVLGIEVAPGATHAYAGVADGGLWRWTPDTTAVPPADVWQPEDEFITGAATPGLSANSLSVGDIAVNFGVDANRDLIFVGTGEVHTQPGGAGPRVPGGIGGEYFGVGVRVSAPVVGAGPRAWVLEAVHLAGQGIFRMVLDTDDPTRVWAATTAGVFFRPAGAVAAALAWPQMGVGGANPLPAGGLFTDIRVGGTTLAGNKVVWVAVDDQGVFRTTDGGVGAAWNLVPGIPVAPAPGRISLAIDESVGNPTVVYAVTELGHLFRFDSAGDTRFRRVQALPGAQVLLRGQGFYDLAVAVAPGSSNRVFIGGATVRSAATGGEWELSAYRSDLTNPAANTFRFNFSAANNGDTRAFRDATYIGRGVHADIHCFAFGRDAAGNLDRTDVWIGCDGGVFRSTTSGNNGTFTSLNTGLATIQLTYIDHHPVHESVVVGGCQDNGVVRSLGHATWLEDPKGDGGGIAIDQTNPFRMMAQGNTNTFFVSVNGGAEWRWFALPITGGEALPFYTQICSAPAAGGPAPPVPVAIPGWALIATDRVWATWDWGTTWVTLPTAAAPPLGNALQDQLDATQIVSVVWPTPNRIYAATQVGVFRIDFNPVAGAWTVPFTPLGGPPGLAVNATEINDLAVANAATDDIYVCLNGVGEHVWWFDQGPPAVWVNTNSLPTFNAPAEAIEVDPGNPLHVWVGTDVGVFQGIHTPPVGAAPRVFGWSLQSTGLPEAAVTDLQAQGGTRMLRAATHGRGAWELPLAAVGGIDPDLFLRMNPADNGRRRPTSILTTDPTRIRRDNVTQVAVDWGDSPDLKLRRGIEGQPAPAFPGRLRLQSPRMVSANVRRWQRHAIRRGLDLTPGNDDAEFGPTSEAAARELQRRYGLVLWANGMLADGIVGEQSWTATVSYPPLPARIDHRAFVTDVREDYDEVTGVLIGDATGNNRVFLQLHNRGSRPVAAADARSLLLLARTVGPGNPPDLPAGWDARIRAADATAWTGASWVFADAGNPYRSPALPLTARDPQVVEWTVDFQASGFAAGDTVIMLAFLTTVPASTTPDVLTNAEVRVRNLIAAERRVAARRVRLDAVAVIP